MRKIRILNYHRINEDDNDLNFTNVTPCNFVDQMRWLYENYKVISVCDLERDEIFNDGPDSVILTFDDGYKDVFTNALPILNQFFFPAMVFISTENIDRNEENWTDLIIRAIFQAKSYNDTFYLKRGLFKEKWYVDTLDKRIMLYKNIREILRLSSAGERDAIISELCEWGEICDSSRESRKIMTSEEIRFIDQSDGISVGAHTVTHPFLSSLTSDEIKWEVSTSKAKIEEIVGHAIYTFAYPFGAYSDMVSTIVKESGFKMAFTSGAKEVTPQTDKMLIPRYSMRNYNKKHFIRKMAEIFGNIIEDEEFLGSYKGELKDDYSLFKSSKDIIICGSGRIGQSLYEKTLRYVDEERIFAFIDNDKRKQGGTLLGKKVLPLDSFEDINQFIFLVTGWYSEEKFQELRALGCKYIHVVN